MDDAEEIETLEAQIADAMIERFPELRHLLVRPFSVELNGSEAWVVARDGAAALFVSLEAERFGVGFLAEGMDLFNTQQYPTAELASQAFTSAAAHGA